jgi:hypothetical protein
MDHQQREIDSETLAATQRMVEKRIMDVLESEDIASAADTAIKFVDQIPGEDIGYIGIENAMPGMSKEEQGNYRRGQKSKIHTAVIDQLTANPLDIEGTRKGIAYYESHKDSLSLKDRSRLTKQMAKTGNDIAIVDTYAELEQLGITSNYTGASEWLEENDYPQEIQRAVKARVRENINEISIQKAEQGKALDDKFIAQWNEIPSDEFELRQQALEDYTDSLAPEDQILFDSHRTKYQRRLRADYPRLRKAVLNRMSTLLGTNPEQYRGELVQDKLREYQQDGILTASDVAALDRKHKEIFGGFDPISGKPTGKRLPEGLPAKVLTWAKDEFNLSDDEAFALEDDFAKWMIASGHAMDPKSYYGDLQEAVRLLVGENSQALLEQSPDLLDDIMYADEVLEGIDMPQNVFRQVYTRVVDAAAAQGNELTPAQAQHIALQVMRESDEIPYEARAHLRGIHNSNVAATQRAKDEARYKEDMGLDPEEELPLVPFAGAERNRVHTERDSAKRFRAAGDEAERQANIRAVLGKHGMKPGQVVDGLAHGDARAKMGLRPGLFESDRRKIYGELLEAGSTHEELRWLRPKPGKEDRHWARWSLGEAWSYIKGSTGAFFNSSIIEEGITDRSSMTQTERDFSDAIGNASDTVQATLNEVPGVIGDALKVLATPNPNMVGIPEGGAPGFIEEPEDPNVFEVPDNFGDIE